MPATGTTITNPLRLIRTLIGVSGLVAAAIGALILIWPGKTAMVVAWTVIAYTLIAGLTYIAVGIFGGERGAWTRAGFTIIGVIFVIAAIVAFSNLKLTAATLATLLGIVMGISWIGEGVVTLFHARKTPSTGWALFYGALSTIAGLIMLFSPLWTMAVVWWLLGISLLALGIVQIIRAIALPSAVD